MNYENLPCPVCGRHMHQEDDIVVCPDCGTPQHRECWMEEGHCANASLHSEGFVWSNEKPTEEIKEEPEKSDCVVCKICGSENPSDFRICANCGASLEGAQAPDNRAVCPYCSKEIEAGEFTCPHCGAPLIPIRTPVSNPYAASTGMDENERIGEFTSGDYSLYVRRSSRRYVPLFKKMEDGRKVSFNWGAFFFGPLWYFFRRIYSVGIVFILLAASASLFFATASDRAYAMLEPYSESIADRTISTEKMNELTTEFINENKYTLMTGAGLMLAINIACAFAADRIYYKRAAKDIGMIKEAFGNTEVQRMYISKRGGTSLLSAVCGYFTLQIACNILLYIAQYVGSLK